jgi:hypothetical protein
MKKGFLLILLVVAVLAMALPVGARAPLVKPIGPVIIGDVDDGDFDAVSGKRLMRYLNVVGLDSEEFIETRNGMGIANLSVYYVSYTVEANPHNSMVVQASDDVGLIEPLTALDRSFLTGSLVEPDNAPAKNLARDGFTWLSLVNIAIHDQIGSGTLPASIYDADFNTDIMGVLPVDYPAGYDALSTITVYAYEQAFDGVTTIPLLGSGSFSVDSVSGAFDSNVTTSSLYSQDTMTSDPGWFNTTATSPTYAERPGSFIPGVGLAFNAQGAGQTELGFGEFTSGDGVSPFAAPVIDADTGTVGPGNILHMTCTIGADAATAAECPGWRILYGSDVLTHLGGVAGSTQAADLDGIHAPSSGSPIDIELFWAVPYALTGYDDEGGEDDRLATFSEINAAFSDARDYKILWSLVDGEVEDSGLIYLQNVEVEVMSVPPGKGADLAWGPGGRAFNDATGLGWFATGQSKPGLALGEVDIDAAGIDLRCVDQAGLAATGYAETTLNVLNLTPQRVGEAASWAADRLVRYKYTLASTTNVNQSPMVRCLGLVYPSGAEVNLPIRSLVYVDQFGADVTAKFWLEDAGLVDDPVPGVPKASGSQLASYFYTHNGDGGVASRLYPTIDAYNAGLYPSAVVPTFPASEGAVRLSAFSIENNI